MVIGPQLAEYLTQLELFYNQFKWLSVHSLPRFFIGGWRFTVRAKKN